MTRYSFIDESGETRLVGTISPAPGDGSQPPTPFVQDADPGAVGEGALWVDTSTDPPSLKIRNTADDDWDAAGGGIPQGGPLTEDLLSGGFHLRGTPATGESTSQAAGFLSSNAAGADGGSANTQGGDGGAGGSGGYAALTAGGGDDGSSVGANIVALGGSGAVNGRLVATTNGETGTAGQVLMSDGAGGVVWADLP